MKKIYFVLVLLFIAINSFAQETEKLPSEPWESLVEMNSGKNQHFKKWNTDIKISLAGVYKASDSLTIARIIKKLNTLTETITINFSNIDSSNVKIEFLDKYRKHKKERVFGWNSVEIINAKLYLYPFESKAIAVKNTLEMEITKVLFYGEYPFELRNQNPKSFFNKYGSDEDLNKKGGSKTDDFYKPLSNEDLVLITEVYKKGFEKQYKKAEKQFKNKVLENIRTSAILNRDSTLWWVQNPFAVMFFPLLILMVLSLFLVGKLKKTTDVSVKNSWLRFTLLALATLFLGYIGIVTYFNLYDFLKLPVEHQYFRILMTDAWMPLVMLFPFLYLFRFIELKIQKVSQNIFTKTALVFLSTGFIPFVFLLTMFYFTVKDHNPRPYLELSIGFLLCMGIAFIRAFIGYFIFKERNLVIENEKKLSDLRELNAKAELKSLQSQINPHFLYNSLNSIASLAPIDAVKTQKMAHSLSDLFKYSINRKGKKMSTVKDEIEMVGSYLEIEKIRFGDRLKFIIEVDEAIENYKIPLFLIQPLVENAVKHGISKVAENGKIVLKIKEQQNKLIITVLDSGPDFPKGLVSGHGLQTVYDLLRLSYENKATLNWTNTPEKLITVTIPKIL